MDHVQLAIVGSGSAGSMAALEGSRRGLSVALIERGQLGGTCLHAGCLPVKSLMVNATRLHEVGADSSISGSLQGHTGGQVLLAEWMSHQRRAVAKLTEQLRTRLLEHEVRMYTGHARLTGERTLEVRGMDGQVQEIHADSIILATGARPLALPELPEDDIVGSSDRYVAMTELPRSLAIIGGGHVGCEFASIFSALGTEVTLVERRGGLLVDLPPEAGEYLERRFEQNGVRVLLNQQLDAKLLERTEKGARLHTSSGVVEVERLLIAAGRVPNVEGLGLEELGIQCNPCVQVDRGLRTSVPGIFAVGDMNGLLPMAHAAAAQGRMAVRNALGENLEVDYSHLPICLYTLPEIARVGLTEAAAVQRGQAVVRGRAHFHSHARAVALGATEGFVDLLVERATHKLLGGLIIGAHAGELISHLALALQLDAIMDDLLEVDYPHPTFSEAIQDAARDAFERLEHGY